LKGGLKKFSGIYGPAVYCSVNMGERSFGTEDDSWVSDDVKPVVLKCDLDITKFLIQGVVSEKYGDLAHYIYGNNSLAEQIRHFYPKAPEEWKNYSSYPDPSDLAKYFSKDPTCPGMIINHNYSVEGSWVVIYDPTRLVIKEYAFLEKGKGINELKWTNAGDIRGLKPDVVVSNPLAASVKKPVNLWQSRLDSIKNSNPNTANVPKNKNDDGNFDLEILDL
jgi:hypothetical protein